MEASQLAAPVRFRAGLGIALTIVVGALALPASAAAGPIEAAAQRAGQLTQPVDRAVDRTGDTAPAVRQTVEQAAARLAPTVRAVTGARPIRSTVQAVTTSVDRAAPGTGPGLTAVVRQLGSHAQDGGRYAAGRPDAGGIDRRASRRSGPPQNRPLDPNAQTGGSPAPQVALDALASAEQLRSNASSTSASGDDGGFDIGQPPFGFDGGGNPLGGPAGIALLALLGLLAATLALIPRFSTRLLHMSPARWGLVAFLVPIERPG